MKKILLTCLMLTFLLQAQAQDWMKKDRKRDRDKETDGVYSSNTNPYEEDILFNPYKNSFYWYLPPLYYQTFQAGYERFFINDFKRRSLHGSIGIILGSERLSSKDGFALEGQYRFYFDQFNPKIDMYGAPYFQYDNVGIERPNFDLETISSMSGGLVMGIKLFVFRQGIIEFQAGGGWRKSIIPKESQQFYERVKAWEFGFTGVFGRGTVAVGFAF